MPDLVRCNSRGVPVCERFENRELTMDIRGFFHAAALAAPLALGAAGVLAQTSGTGPKTTNTYKASSTSEDIRVSCKNFEIKPIVSVSPTATVQAECNKTLDNGTVDAVSTTLDMLTYAKCTDGNRVAWGTGSSDAELVGPFILLTSTGNSYVFGAYCLDDGTRYGPSGVDIGDTTSGLKNDAGSLAKR